MSTALLQTRSPEPEWRGPLELLTADLDAAALQWISGFTAALALERSARGAVVQRTAGTRATVLYGSQTGHGRRVAEQLGAALERSGHAVRVLNAIDYESRELASERLLFVVMSTHGDGDPPDDARALFDFLRGRRAPALAQLAYAVLALGDSSYPKYCEAGRAIDERLAALGARRLSARIDCDVDFESAAGAWLEQAATSASEELGEAQDAFPPAHPHLRVLASPGAAASEPTREHPLEAELLANQPITGRGSLRTVHHLELAFPAGQLDYHPGDALGVIHENPPEVVERVLALAGLDGQVPVVLDGRELPLYAWLAHERELTRLTRPFIEAHRERLVDEAARAQPLLVPQQWQVADLLRHRPAAWTAVALVESLRGLAPRLYSIASSRLQVGDEVHLAVAALEHLEDGERRYGSASRYLASQHTASRLRVFLESNQRFRLPADAARDVIMIGPGTGVAPFRGFVQERAATGATGRNWLFFGARHMERDFLYQTEWQAALKRGTLHRLDLAFSRDQAERVYVQQRLREQGAQLFHWLESGAYLYVCGDATHMAPDVHAALLEIVARQGALEPDAATAYLATLMAERRYVRDVY